MWLEGDGTAKTLTVFVSNSNGVQEWSDDEVWVEVSYPSESGGARHTRRTTQPHLLATPSLLTDDAASDWNGRRPRLERGAADRRGDSARLRGAGVLATVPRARLRRAGVAVLRPARGSRVTTERQWTIPGFGGVDERAARDWTAPRVGGVQQTGEGGTPPQQTVANPTRFVGARIGMGL